MPDVNGNFSLSRSPSHLLHRALQLALDLYAEEIGVNDLTQRQFAVLVAVSAREGLTQTDLVAATGIDRSTLADMVARMITKGLLARARSVRDARANAVSLTDAGRAAMHATLERVMRVDEKILDTLPKSLRDVFLSALQHLSHIVDEGEGLIVEDGKKKKKKKERKKREKKAKGEKKADKKPKKEKKKKKKDKAEAELESV